jgi:hypothetical protein
VKTTERCCGAFEAAFLLRQLLGPDFGNFYTLLADQRRGKKTTLPVLPYSLGGGIPYYLHSDLMSFVQAVRAHPKTKLIARTGVATVFWEYDFDKEMSL